MMRLRNFSAAANVISGERGHPLKEGRRAEGAGAADRVSSSDDEGYRELSKVAIGFDRIRK